MANQWYYTPDGRTRVGPVPLPQLQQLVRSGELKRTHMVRREEEPRWAVAGTFAELFPPSLPPPAAAGIVQQPAVPAPLSAPQGQTAPASWRTRLSLPLRRAGLLLLMRRLERRKAEREQCFVDLGVRLLGEGAAVPGCEALAQKLPRLSQARELARQAARADRSKRTEAAHLELELRSLYAAFGRRALASGLAFDGRAGQEARVQALDGAVALAEQQVEARTREHGAPTRRDRLVWAGAGVAVGLLVVLLGILLWPSGSTSAPAGTPPVAAEQPPTPDKPPARRTLQELFAHLAPAVPLIEAGESTFGSGFLIKKAGNYLVVTNRHVVENAAGGLKVHFLHGKSGEEKFTITAPPTAVRAIHRTADLALVDVTRSARDIERLKIEPVRLAPAGELPPEGAHVFAIGHPGAGSEVLTRTLSDGIVSAKGRKVESATYLQVTVPINPGNSGGPLFDDEGRVVGVNTFVVRSSPGRGVTLEALNFALEGSFVHEILDDPSKSLDAPAIAKALEPSTDSPEKLAEAMTAKVQRLLKAGFRPHTGSLKSSTRVFPLSAGKQRIFQIHCPRAGMVAAVAVSQGAKDIDLAVLNISGGLLAKDDRPGNDAEVTFQANTPGLYSVVVSNPSEADGLVVMTLLSR